MFRPGIKLAEAVKKPGCLGSDWGIGYYHEGNGRGLKMNMEGNFWMPTANFSAADLTEEVILQTKVLALIAGDRPDVIYGYF